MNYSFNIHTGPLPKVGDCAHCYHSTGVTLCSNPPQIEERCCWCGAYRNLRTEPLNKDTTPHGAYKPGGLK